MNDPDTIQQRSSHRIFDIIAQYREQVFYKLSIAGIILILPFAVSNLMKGENLLATFNFLVILILLIDAIYRHFRRELPIAPAVAFIAIILNISLTIIEINLIGILWIYPTFILMFFVLTRKTANIIGIFSIILITGMAYYSEQSIQATTRVLASMILTVIFVNMIVKIIVELQNKLRDSSIIDELTQAYNRRYLNDALENAIARLKRYDNNISLILLDIDHFKKINDTFGHSAGDHVLKELVQIIWGTLRTIDMVFRMGGEEFIILLPETTLSNATQVAEKLRLKIQEKPIVNSTKVTISAGVIQLDKSESIDELMKRVDELLYKAKNSGRNRICSGSETVVNVN